MSRCGSGRLRSTQPGSRTGVPMTFASSALDAGISIFELARFMGCGVRVIDGTYGHLVRGAEHRAREKLDARAEQEQTDAAMRSQSPGLPDAR